MARSMISEEYLELLKEFGADTNPHSGDVLVRHLIQTHDILASWGNPTETCVAGLFHSIYGTRSFRVASAELEQRSKVRRVIGSTSEDLAYLFCVCDRRTFQTNINKRPIRVRDERHGRLITIQVEVLQALIEIEMANFLEQTPRVHRTPQRLSDCRSFVEEARRLISAGAYATLVQEIESEQQKSGPQKPCLP